ncbi:unnamed protein product [Heterotrigona itama]|uniref:Uncharacterized protein n=1 Tax=Heterotrigona itama TaxID=395501 RepID=A0A6V7HJK3_9HYME|nr:unnamed protein product [Heterotrigona itama]
MEDMDIINPSIQTNNRFSLFAECHITEQNNSNRNNESFKGTPLHTQKYNNAFQANLPLTNLRLCSQILTTLPNSKLFSRRKTSNTTRTLLAQKKTTTVVLKNLIMLQSVIVTKIRD